MEVEEEEEGNDENEENEDDAAQWAPYEGSYRHHILQILLASNDGVATRDEIVEYVQKMRKDAIRVNIVTALGKEKNAPMPLWEQSEAQYLLTTHGKALHSDGNVALHLSDTSASGYKGVYPKSPGSIDHYVAVYKAPRTGGKQVYLGSFATAKQAALCYAKYVSTLSQGTGGDGHDASQANTPESGTGKRAATPALKDGPNKTPKTARTAAAVVPTPAASAHASLSTMPSTSPAPAPAATPAVTGGGYGLVPKVAVIKRFFQMDSNLPPLLVVKNANEYMGIDAAPSESLPSQVSALLLSMGIDEETLTAQQAPAGLSY